MNKNKNNNFYERLDEVIHYLWDPIGISDCPGARDEYYSYLPTIEKMVNNNKSKKEIGLYLNNIQTERMGLRPDLKRCEKIATIIIDWKNLLIINKFNKKKYWIFEICKKTSCNCDFTQLTSSTAQTRGR